jgi:ubiquinone/menaquinone biosynthesis C-methylase UbiE
MNSESRRMFIASSIATLSSSSIISSAAAISPLEASRDYDIYAKSYDNLDGGTAASALGLDEARAKLLQLAKGDVLEIGVGTGLNLSSYRLKKGGNDGITSLTLVDISEGMLSQAKSKVQELGLEKSIPVKIIQADATSQLVELFGNNQFDTVVDTFSLCVMGNEGAERCLRQMADVMKSKDDGGQMLLIENTRSSNPLLGAYQDITASSAAGLGGKGCLYNQDVGKMIQKNSGLMLLQEDAYAAGLFRSFICEKRQS